MTLWLIRSDLSQRDLMRWTGLRGYSDTDRAMHCLLTESFGDEMAPRPFRAIIPRHSKLGTLYGYSAEPLERLLEQQAMFADPLQKRILPEESFDSKEMPDALWTEGKRMGFEIRVRPLRQTHATEARERDAYERHLKNYPDSKLSREQVYAHWLAERLERKGALLDMDSVQMASFRYCPMHRQKNGPDALMRGNLMVTDSHLFQKALSVGVGRQRTFGYGMLMPKPLMLR